MHPCEPAPPNPDQVFGEHKGVLDALDPHGSSLTSGHFGVALTTMLCPSGVTVYGITHSGSVRFSQQRSLLRPPVTRRYYDEVAAETEQLQTFDESARLLSQLAATQPECIRLWSTMGENVSPRFRPAAPDGASARGDAFVDPIVKLRNTSAWKAKQAARTARGRNPADQFAEEVCAYDEYGPAIESLEECHRWRYGQSWPHYLIVGSMSVILLGFAALALREWCLNRAQKRDGGRTEASTLLAK